MHLFRVQTYASDLPKKRFSNLKIVILDLYCPFDTACVYVIINVHLL